MEIIEIIPDDLPEWAIEEMARGQLFNGMLTRIRDLQEALQWCGGSKDFVDGGQARQGWLKIVVPLLTDK